MGTAMRHLAMEGLPGFPFRCLGPYFAVLLAVASLPAQDSRFPSARQNEGLLTFPPTRAIPIQSASPTGNLAPSAVSPQHYCDSETLQPTATIRSIRFLDNHRGIAVGDHGLILVTSDGGKRWGHRSSTVQCRLDDAIWIDRHRLVAVGGGYDAVTRISRGAVVISSDGGQTWQRGNDSELPRLNQLRQNRSAMSARSNRDEGIIATGDQDPVSGATHYESTDGLAWTPVLDLQMLGLVGSESKVAGVMDARRAATWSTLTGAKGTIRASCRLDDGTLICAGDHGLIFRSLDQGKTWHSVRDSAFQPGATAVVFIASDLESVPWALIGRESLEQRLRCAILVGIGESLSKSQKSHRYDAASLAAMGLGISSMDFFLIESAEESLSDWIATHQSPVLALDRHLDTNLKTLLLQRAVAVGATKVIEYSSRQRGESILHSGAMMPRTGMTAGDFDADARLSIDPLMRDKTHAQWTSIKTRYHTGDASRRSFLGDGVRLTEGHRLPERTAKASRRRLQVLQGRMKQNAAISRLLNENSNPDSAIGSTRTFPEIDQALNVLFNQTSPEDRFRLTWSLANESQNPINQIAIWSWVSEQFPNSTACKLAKLYVDTRSTSAEWKLIEERPSPEFSAERKAGAPVALPNTIPSSSPIVQVSGIQPSGILSEQLPQPGVHSTIVSPFQEPTSNAGGASPFDGVVQAGAISPISVPELSQLELSKAHPIDDVPVDLAWQMHPMRLIIADAVTRAESESATNDLSEPIESGDSKVSPTPVRTLSADLRLAADRGTLWSNLLKESSPQITRALRAERPPRLDGQFDEPFWQGGATTRESQPTTISVAFNDRFVFLALRTPTPRFGTAGTNSKDLGTRDAELSTSDRMILQLDLDRDLLTGFELHFTRDGRTRDSIDGHNHWDPIWYLASKIDGNHVHTEIAIERVNLCERIEPGDRWFIQARTAKAGSASQRPWLPDANTRVRVDF